MARYLIYKVIFGMVAFLGAAPWLLALQADEIVSQRLNTDESLLSVDDPVTELLQNFPQTEAMPKPKQDKRHPEAISPSNRRGSHAIVTTLFNVHTREAMPIIRRITPPVELMDHLFRCRGFGVTQKMDKRLLPILLDAAKQFDTDRVEIISAFRSAKFNDALLKKGRRVALDSFHSKGRAIDFRLVDTPAGEVGKWIWSHWDGGVGIYQADDFIHIDTGRKRRWYGK